MGGGAWSPAVGGLIVKEAQRRRDIRDETVTIRPAHEKDILGVGLIERQSFSDPWGSREFTTALASPQTIFSVAVDEEGIVVGYVIAVAVVDEGEILNLAVHSAHRGRGIGGKLLDQMVGTLRSAGAENIYLEVRESNGGALKLYASRGFDEISRRERYYRHPLEDALVLRLAMH